MTNYAMIYNPADGLKTQTWTGDSYAFLKGAVGGYIEHLCVSDFPDGIDVWINEDGKYTDMTQSSWLMFRNAPYDYTVGNLVFTRVDGEDTVSLTDEDIKAITEFFANADYSMALDMEHMVPKLHY